MHTKRQLHHYCGLALLVCLFAPGAAAQIGLGLSPMRLELNVEPGAQRTGSLTLTNDSLEEARYRTEIVDFSLDKEAVPQFEKDIPAESPYSCKKWITFNPMEPTIPPKTNLLVRYTIRVPAGVSALTYHCAGGFNSLPPVRSEKSEGIGMQAAVEMIAAFYMTVGNPKPQGELKEIALQKIPQASGLRALFKVDNTGLTNLRGIGSVEVLDSTGAVVETKQFPTAVILPKRTQLLPLVLEQKLADGDYTLRARVNVGTGEIQEATLGFRPPPPEK